MSRPEPSIAVLGCGPAAVVCAVELARLGYAVTVIGTVRNYDVVEGISERVYGALQHAGLHHALATISEQVPRRAIWDGISSNANHERLLQRRNFDRALLSDLCKTGIEVIEDRVVRTQRAAERWQIDTAKSGTFTAHYLVEARGRAAPLAERGRVRGPETLSLGGNWRIDPTHPPQTLAISLKQGWLWCAISEPGQLFAQANISAEGLSLSGKGDAASMLIELINQNPASAALAASGQLCGDVMGRSSTSILLDQPLSEGVIRIGDAAMAVDPLSGNGIFQSLSSALAAPAVINTLMQRPQDAELAQQFYRDRLHHLFYRFARMGRDFYRLPQALHDQPFWQVRRQWPDDREAHSTQDEVVGTGLRPVLNGGFIEQREVVITRDQPLGIWQVNGVEAVSLLRQSGQ